MTQPDAPFLSRWSCVAVGSVVGETRVTEVTGETTDEGTNYDASTRFTRVQGETSDESEQSRPAVTGDRVRGSFPFLARWAFDAPWVEGSRTSMTKATGETSDEAL